MKKFITLVLGVLLNTLIFADWLDNMTYDRQSKKASEMVERVAFIRPNDKNGKTAVEVIYKKGARNGEVKVYTEEGGLLVEGYYKDDKKDGLWKFYLNGAGILHFSETYANGLLNGEKTGYYKDGKTIAKVTNYINGKREGKEIQYYKDGKTVDIETNYIDDKETGERKEFYYTGEKSAYGYI